MKALVTTFFLLGSASFLHAGEEAQTTGKFRFVHTSDGNQRVEAEAQSVLERGSASIPLMFPSNILWICSVDVDLDRQLLYFNVVQRGAAPAPAQGQEPAREAHPPEPLLQLTHPLKTGQEMVLVKSTAFTLTATVTLTREQAAPDAAPPGPEIPAGTLTDEELKKVPIKTTWQPDRILVSGYNPFQKGLGAGVLRVTLPKTATEEETVRDYAVTFNAAGLADFSGQVSAALALPKGEQPVCKLVKLSFLP